MAYDIDKWKKRMSNRSDITGYITHLTRPELDVHGKIVKNALEVLIKILNDKKLLGSSTSSGFIVGTNRAVCFQEAPLYGIGQNVLHEQIYRNELGGKIRYQGIGLAFSKPYMFNKGARPVIYEKTEIAKGFLEKEEWYKIVNYDFTNREKIIDWTHEREWRLKGDFKFDLGQTTVLLPNSKMYRKLIEEVEKPILKQLKGIVSLNNLIY